MGNIKGKESFACPNGSGHFSEGSNFKGISSPASIISGLVEQKAQRPFLSVIWLWRNPP